MRIPYARGLNNASRVQNDVAAQHIVRQYIYLRLRCLEELSETSFGWILSKYQS